MDAVTSNDKPFDLHADLARVNADTRAAAPLLLLLSRERLTEAQARIAREIAAEVPDWGVVRRIAERKFGLPFVYGHVRNLGLLPEDHPELQAMRQSALHYAIAWLRLATAQKNFLETCLEPAGIRHVFFKGVAMGAYFDVPGLRFARDIDIVVRPEDLKRLIERARAAGYRPILDRNTGRLAASERDMQVIYHYKNDVPLLSPEGVQIEVHTDIWHGEGYCDNETVLNAAVPVQVNGATYNVLPPTMLFSYLAYHHNRHLWSHLNWLADIPAVRNAPGFDESEARDVARRLGLLDLVEATLAFDDLIGGVRVDGGSVPGRRARECRDFCILNLEGDVQTERGLYFRRIPPDQDWRRPPRLQETDFHRKWRSRLSPNLDQYIRFPLPLWLHWVYPVQRAFSKLAGRGDERATGHAE